MRILFGSKDQRQKIAAEVAAILHLPFWSRLLHSKSRKPVVGFSVGVLIMVTGSAIASSVKHAEALPHLATVMVDTFGYLLHGIGSIPIIKHAEPVWALVFGVAQEV